MSDYATLIASIPGDLHKTGHILGFLVLYVLFHSALFKCKFGWRVLFSMFACISVACVDESIRGFNIEDVALDGTSASFAATFYIMKFIH